MKYLGDYTEDYSDLNFKFSTHKADGTPYALAGATVKVYKSNATATESTSGVTLTTDFDSVTGLNNVKVDLSSDAFYAAGNDYAVVITAGTVNAVSVVGTVVALFSIANRYMRGTDGAATSTQAADILAAVGTVGTGVGGVSWLYHVTVDNVARAGAWVGYYTDANRLALATQGRTDSSGNVTLHLDAGHYYVKVIIDGFPESFDEEDVA